MAMEFEQLTVDRPAFIGDVVHLVHDEDRGWVRMLCGKVAKAAPAGNRKATCSRCAQIKWDIQEARVPISARKRQSEAKEGGKLPKYRLKPRLSRKHLEQ